MGRALTRAGVLIRESDKMACAPSEDSDQPRHPPNLFESSLSAQCVVKDPSFLHADSVDFDQTGRMPRLICWADVSLRWAHMPFCWFCHDVVHIFQVWAPTRP